MSLTYGIKHVMHRIKVKLYPNYLPKGDAFLARTDSEAILGIEEVCAAMKERGGFTGNIDDLVNHIKMYYKEVVYQLCDGYTVSNGYYAIYPNLGGTFRSIREIPDYRKHPLTFRIRVLKLLRDLVEHIKVEIEGEAVLGGYIDIFTDTRENSKNEYFVPGNMFVLTGDKIKIEGDHADNGLYFVPKDNPAGAVRAIISENFPSKVTGMCPRVNSQRARRAKFPEYNQFNKLEIRTQYAGGSFLLKEPRVITSDFILEEA